MSKSITGALSKEEIEEELINNDLISSGGVDNQEHLQQMGFEEKQNLLKGIKQSKEEFQNETISKPSNQPKIDITSSSFPSLPPAGKNNTGTRNKLIVPRKGSPAKDPENSPDRSICLFEKEPELQQFILPFCVDDGAPPLPPLNRPLKRVENPYYVKKGETPLAAVKRMLAHHDRWKELYLAEMSTLDSHALGEDIEEGKEQKASPRSDIVEEKENNPYDFSPDSPVRIPSKMYTGPRKRDTNQCVDTSFQPSSCTLQRKASRDSDCEEVEPILKPEKPKVNDRISTRPRNKRYRNQASNHEKNQTESTVNVEFDFENRWDQKSQWQGSQSPSSSSLNNQTPNRRSVPGTPVVEEEKVQCPICQHDFAQSKVENHAATCEGYSGSGSPMDVEES